MKYSKEKKEKIKAGATATAGVLLVIGASIGMTLGVVSAVQDTKEEDKLKNEIISLTEDKKKLEKNIYSGPSRKIAKYVGVQGKKIKELEKKQDKLKNELKTFVENLIKAGVNKRKELDKIFPKWKYYLGWKGVLK